MRQFNSIAKAIADPGRVRALLALRGGELCACQLIDLLELAPSTVSRHMALLAQAGLVEWRKEGRWRYYRIPDPQSAPAAKQTLDWIEALAGHSPIVREDAKRLKAICRRGKEEVSACCYRN